MRLTDKQPNKVLYKNRTYRTKITYGRVLRSFEVIADNELDSFDKINICLKLFVRSKIKLFLLSPIERIGLMEVIYKNCISNKKGDTGKKTFDFVQDAAYIYAAFRQAYNINLLEVKDTLSWDEFYSLFVSLPDNTKLMQIIDIRTKPIPKATKYNASERMNIIRLKNRFRLELTQEEREAELQRGFAKIAMALEGLARKK